MPSIKDFEKNAAAPKAEAMPKKTTKPRRRPGRDEAALNETHDDIEPQVTESVRAESVEAATSAETATEAATETATDAVFSATEEDAGENVFPGEESEPRKVDINFPFSEILRARAPQAFELAEAVATDWVHDGRFEALPVGHPVAQLAAQVGLRKAKDLEKKLDEKGVFMLARVGYQYAKSKLGRR